jgi:hypothetical protein
MLVYDDNIKHVARIVQKLNPCFSGCTPDYVEAHMMQVAQQSLDVPGSGYVSTSGYVMSAYHKLDSVKIHVYSSVAHYLFAEESA